MTRHPGRPGTTGPGQGQGRDHGHGHGTTATGRHRQALMTVLALSAVIAVAEVTGALITGSLVLLADAAHMAADVSGIGLSLLAAHFAARPPTGRRTFGYPPAAIPPPTPHPPPLPALPPLPPTPP